MAEGGGVMSALNGGNGQCCLKILVMVDDKILRIGHSIDVMMDCAEEVSRRWWQEWQWQQ
jgi:hypothetical protein